jgi:hypothetical protein
LFGTPQSERNNTDSPAILVPNGISARLVLEFHFSTLIGKKNTAFPVLLLENLKVKVEYPYKWLKFIASVEKILTSLDGTETASSQKSTPH